MAIRMRSSRPLIFAILVLISVWGARARYLSEVQEEDRVVDLPGVPNVNFAHYSGYVTVNKVSGRSLFFWFFEAADKPEEKPLLLWVNGANDSLVFLTKWLKRYPQYKGRDFYISGESYAEHYVPQLAQVIVRHNDATGDKSINLKGYMVGNALTDDYHDHFGVFEFMWSAGLISDQTYKNLNVLCYFQSFIHSSSECEKILQFAYEEFGNIDPYSIFTPSCTANAVFSKNKLLKRLQLLGRLNENYDPALWNV